MSCRGDVLPIVLVIFLPFTCVVTYLMAVLLGHVDPEFPYISDTGTIPPESCVFGILLGLYAFLCAFAVYIRYSQIATWCTGNLVVARANTAALTLGLVASFGMFLVANFQETNLKVVHLCGAFLSFVGIDLYFWVQTVLSYAVRNVPGYCRGVPHFRLLLTFLHLSSCIATVVCGSKASSELKADTHVNHFHWHSGDGGFSWHVASASLEWTVAMLSAVYFLSFIKEFSHFRFTLPQVKFTNIANMNGIENGGFVMSTITPK